MEIEDIILQKYPELCSELKLNKNVEDLSLEEMATLVALLKGPSYYNPDNFPERLNKRINMILSMHNKYKRIIN